MPEQPWTQRRAIRINGVFDQLFGLVAGIAAAPNVQRPRPFVDFMAARSGRAPHQWVAGMLTAWRQERSRLVGQWTTGALARPIVATAATTAATEQVKAVITPVFQP